MAPNLPRGPGKPVTLETLALNLRTYVPLSAFHVGAVARGGCPNKPATGAYIQLCSREPRPREKELGYWQVEAPYVCGKLANITLPIYPGL